MGRFFRFSREQRHRQQRSDVSIGNSFINGYRAVCRNALARWRFLIPKRFSWRVFRVRGCAVWNKAAHHPRNRTQSTRSASIIRQAVLLLGGLVYATALMRLGSVSAHCVYHTKQHAAAAAAAARCCDSYVFMDRTAHCGAPEIILRAREATTAQRADNVLSMVRANSRDLYDLL